MLSNLFVKNYALIEELSVNFQDNLSIITGETGAGKSILLGALGLVLGNRADSTVLKNTAVKCIIEGQFNIRNYNLESLFEKLDIDYEEQTIIRREILPSGKSRAFINDTPTTLNVLQQLSSRLIDVHSQHQTLSLANEDFQFKIVDTLAGNNSFLLKYKEELSFYKEQLKILQNLKEKQAEANTQYKYNLHLFEELNKANLVVGEQQKIEEQLAKLNNVEAIKTNLSEALSISFNEDYGLQNQLNQIKNNLQKIASFSSNFKELNSRIESLTIEFKDIIAEIENEFEAIDFNENQLEELNQRLQLLFNLQKKHLVNSEEELIVIKDQLEAKVSDVENLSQQIKTQEAKVKQSIMQLNNLAERLHHSRKEAIPILIQKTEEILSQLGMENTRLKIDLILVDDFLTNGKDKLTFQISANKGLSFGSVKKIASGGELSRIMLAFKYILSSYLQLPTIIFDEIDAGVSGDISNKMAEIMVKMGNNMQVITITHLPQIAAKGQYHYKVFKTDIDNNIVTQLKLLNKEERVVEIAEMLSSKSLSETAIEHAKELLN